MWEILGEVLGITAIVFILDAPLCLIAAIAIEALESYEDRKEKEKENGKKRK